MQASLKASLASLRDEMNRKIQALTIEIAQLQKQMNVGRGEQSILAQQQKDTSKRVDILCVVCAGGLRAPRRASRRALRGSAATPARAPGSRLPRTPHLA